jgi:hypothetical protein
MAFFDRFTKRWASTGVATEPTDGQAAAGFAHLGANPPTVEEFNALFQLLDEKDNWLFEKVSGIMAAGGVTAASGSTSANYLTALRALFGGTGLLAANGYMRLPGSLIVQWGTNSTGVGGNVNFAFPLAFPNACRIVLAMEASADGWGPGSCRVFGDNLKTQAGTIISSAVVTSGSVSFGSAAFFWLAVGD